MFAKTKSEEAMQQNASCTPEVLAALTRISARGDSFTLINDVHGVSGLAVMQLNFMGYLEIGIDPKDQIGMSFRLSATGWLVLSGEG